MLLNHGLRQGSFALRCNSTSIFLRSLHYDGRNRLSNFWTPTQAPNKGSTSSKSNSSALEDGHDLLLRAGYLRQAHSGIFHLLPLGLRIQNKLEALIDKHMQSLGASKVALSSLSSQDLWERSGRLEGRGSEFFRLEDRKEAKYILAPTHEEEITSIVANTVQSYKDLPLRLYQITRKYRDEARPRQGLLRGREFVMKDLYTFDATEAEAKETYEEVRKAYSALLEELKLPFLVANADSGNMGGKLSHEYHFVSPNGEDTIIGCDSCDFSMNEELYVGRYNAEEATPSKTSPLQPRFWTGISKDRRTLIHVCYPASKSSDKNDHSELNIYAVKAIFPELDSSVENAASAWKHAQKPMSSPSSDATKSEDFTQLFYADPRLSTTQIPTIVVSHPSQLQTPMPIKPRTPTLPTGEPILLTRANPSTSCPSCASPTLQLHRAIEIGHTFHLNTRYSIPLHATALSATNTPAPISMGCHGIGVSRLIGSIASLLADTHGLNWPISIAPFSTVIVPTANATETEIESVYDQLIVAPTTAPSHVAAVQVLDAIIDDRARATGWKLKDADLIGYPIIVVLGKEWATAKKAEVQCRRLGVKESVAVGELRGFVDGLVARL
ncbi:proline--trna ligase [Acrodontium crateriforme]|uniref:proline--tRNA ligase n=1 Tax=Acrodontium crateriforme TaxID=150365 RepID=A0AAQ3M0L2_9PEZI|nr:proline--trna ligase [Acrodontium crateriforme]